MGYQIIHGLFLERIMKKRETVGKIAQDILNKTPETLDPIELQQEMQKEYIDNLIFAVEHAKKRADCSTFHENKPCDILEARLGDFYIIVITKKERLLQNVVRNYFFTRDACPTPDYDQAVYRYNSHDDSIEFVWVIPDKETCLMMLDNKMHIPPEQGQLLQFILDFKDGTLFMKAKKLNGEEVESSLLAQTL